MRIEDLPTQLSSKLEVDQATDCWLWTAYRDKRGYGKVNWRRKARFAHRVIWIIFNGEPPEGTELDHLCRVRSCCFPGHLEPVSHDENVKRGSVGEDNRKRWAAMPTCRKGHERTPENVNEYVRPDGYVERKCRPCRRAQSRRSR